VNNFEHLSVDEAQEMLKKEQVTIVDIRDPQTFSEGHIPHAKSITDENVEIFVKETNKEKPLICYCYHGISSQSAAAYFAQQGFKHVYSVDGGFEEWRKAYENL
jgi:thiosulfate sulfurtransferase